MIHHKYIYSIYMYIIYIIYGIMVWNGLKRIENGLYNIGSQIDDHRNRNALRGTKCNPSLLLVCG